MTIFDNYLKKTQSFSRVWYAGNNSFTKKTLFTFLTIGAGLGFFGSDSVKAQDNFNLKQTVEADTLWSTGTFQTLNEKTMDGVPNVL